MRRDEGEKDEKKWSVGVKQLEVTTWMNVRERVLLKRVLLRQYQNVMGF